MKLLISGYKPKKKRFWDKLKRHLPTPTPREVLPNTNKPPSYSKFDPSFIIDKNISHHESFSNINGDKWLSDLLNEKNVHHMQHLCRELQKPDRYFGQIYKKLMCEIPSPQKSGQRLVLPGSILVKNYRGFFQKMPNFNTNKSFWRILF